jgi:uncharacterized membrane protein
MNPSISGWLSQGWHYFLLTRWISMLFSSLFVLIGAVLYWVLTQYDLGLITYPFLSGFLILAPVLATGFQRVARMLNKGQSPRFRDLVFGIAEGTPGIWFLILILFMCYLIWVTDAIVIYGMFFGVKAIPVNLDLLTDETLRSQLFAYIAFASVVGCVMAFMGFAVSVFSIPLILHQQKSFVSAVHTSVTLVFRNKLLMLRWALTLAILVMTTLFVALPLLVIVLPVTGYASYAAYAEMLEAGGKGTGL